MLKVPILVAIPGLQQLQQRIAKSGVHPDSLPGVITPHTVTRERLLEERLVIGASTVEVTRRRISRRVCPTLSARIVPGAQRIPRTIQ